MQQDLYRVDNILLKAGIATAAVLVFVAVTWRPWEARLPTSAAQGQYLVTQLGNDGRLIDTRVHVHDGIDTEAGRMANLEGRYPDAILIRRAPAPRFSLNLARGEWYLAAAALAPLVLLGAGLYTRRREKRTLSIWRHLRQNVETDVRALLANSDFTRDELEATVRLLNNRGLAFYTWDRRTDVIEDGRLAAEYVHIDHCVSCGASVGITVRANLRKPPLCPYCHGGLRMPGLNEIKSEALHALRSESTGAQAVAGSNRLAMERRSSDARPMSIWLFVFLVVFCWPAAIAYAVYKSQAKQRVA